MFLQCMAVGAGGFIGSVFRYLMGMIPAFSKVSFPLHTLIINIAGAVIIGMLVKASQSWDFLSGHTLLLLKVGVCGGFTTFSTFALGSAEMIESGKTMQSLIYVSASVVLCIAGVYIGKYIASLIQI